MKNKHLISIITAMLIFGSIGVFRKQIPLPSAFIAFLRGIIGSVFLLIFILIKNGKVDFAGIKKNLFLLIVSGMSIGINWILLFEAYNQTSVSVATTCYYISPILLILGSIIFYKEKFTAKKGICILTSIVGMLLVSGITNGLPSGNNLIGILLALSAGFFYAVVTLISKKIKDVSNYEIGLVELFIAGITVIPYSLGFEKIEFSGLEPKSIVYLILLGILHTGIAYALFFVAANKLPAASVAICSYIDPASALIFSYIFLEERIGIIGFLGAAMIILSSFVANFNFKRSKQH